MITGPIMRGSGGIASEDRGRGREAAGAGWQIARHANDPTADRAGRSTAVEGRLVGALGGSGRGRPVVRFGLARGLEERAGEGELGGPMAIGEEAEVADAMEAIGQGVEEEAPDELARGQTHGHDGAVAAVVFPGEGDVVLVAGHEAAVGDSDAMGVAAEIGKDLGGAAERLLGVDDPIDPPQAGEMACEVALIGERGQIPEEAQLPVLECGGEPLEEEPAEEAGKRLHGQEEVGPAMDPACAVRREAAAWDDTVQMGMMGERLAPRMQHGDGADLGAETARIGGERGQGFGSRLEQDGVDDCLVLERHGPDGRGNGEDDMEVGHGQEFARAGGEPPGPCWSLALRAMPVAAGVIGDARGPTRRAGLDMATEGRRPARHDRAHDATLDPAEMTVMTADVIRGVAAQHVCEFEAGACWIAHDRQIADRHVLDHASAQRAHRGHRVTSCLRGGMQHPRSSQAGHAPRDLAPSRRGSGFVQSLRVKSHGRWYYSGRWTTKNANDTLQSYVSDYGFRLQN